MDKSITFTTVGYTAAIIATFSKTDNPSQIWSPSQSNIVIHMLGDDPTGTENPGTDSTFFVTNSTQWNTFKSKAFTNLKVTSTLTRDWTTAYNSGAYLLNVASATFSITPVIGSGEILAQKVYAWKLERGGVIGASLGSENTVTLTGFTTTDVIHVYLTTATSPNPRIKYDGFDTTSGSIVPADQAVYADSDTTEWPVGKVWNAFSLVDSFTVFLSPKEWAAQSIGIARSVILDQGETREEEIVLTGDAGAGLYVTTGPGAYSVKNVKFKQIEVDPSVANLTANIIITADTDVIDNLSVSLTFTQLTKTLGTITESGTIGYYVGDVPIIITPTVNYGGEPPTNFVVRIVPAIVYPDDYEGLQTYTLDASADTRAFTFYLTQVVPLGDLTQVSIYKRRDTSMGTVAATSSGPITIGVMGDVSVTMTNGQSSGDAIIIECVAGAGYTLASVYIVDAADDGIIFAAKVAVEGTNTIFPNIPYDRVVGEAGVANIKVIVSVEAEIVPTPLMLPMVEDDRNKFAAEVINTDGYLDFRVGDLVTLTAGPVGSITGLAIGNPTFNDVQMIANRPPDSRSISLTVTLGQTSNVFRIPAYAEFTPSTNPVDAVGSITGTTWSSDNKLVISGVTYYRIGMTFTVTTALTWVSGITYTVISAQINRRIVPSGSGYSEIGTLLPVVASDVTRTFSGVLSGQTQCVITYAQGVTNPFFSVAAFDYGANAYITQGLRPTVITAGISTAVLSDDLTADEGDTWDWASDPGTPGDSYKAATFLVRKVTSVGKLPQISLRVSSTVTASLEVFNTATSTWMPYLPITATLSKAFTYFRVCIGDAPSDLVEVDFKEAVNTLGDAVPGGKFSMTSGADYDISFTNPGIQQVRSRGVLYVRFAPPSAQYVVTGWFVNDLLKESGSSLSVAVPDTGLILRPQLSLRSVYASAVMVLGGSADSGMTGYGSQSCFERRSRGSLSQRMLL
jgi:hypothetical protein